MLRTSLKLVSTYFVFRTEAGHVHSIVFEYCRRLRALYIKVVGVMALIAKRIDMRYFSSRY
jgi:hypothetical protein